MLKRVVKAIARQHGMTATFMAKPYAEAPGSGLHIHVSLFDRKGQNIFAPSKSRAKTRAPFATQLRHAVGGLAQTMVEAMAIFGPNANSYRRLRPGAYAPLSPSWGVNHRFPAMRIPLSGPEDTRIEHRVAGADANPYLVMAAVLAGIHHGLVHRCQPGEMIECGQVIQG